MPRGRPRGASSAADRPRGRMTAYAFFVQTCRTEHRRQHPEEHVQFAQFSRQCSERWRTMSAKEKRKFHDLADGDKARYDAEMRSYAPLGPRRRGRRGSSSSPSRAKDPNRPKRALSAFFYYANEERGKVRAANPDFSVGEVAKELGRQWNELAEGDKVRFERMAEDDRARYDREMALYKAAGVAMMANVGEEAAASPAKKAKTATKATTVVMMAAAVPANGHSVRGGDDGDGQNGVDEDDDDDEDEDDDDDDEEEEEDDVSDEEDE